MNDAITLTDEEQAKAVEYYQKNLVAHIEEIQGVDTLEDYQRKVIQAVSEHDRVAVAACHDVGKTFLMARIVLALGSSFPNSKIITTAPTWPQVEFLLWSEINAGFARSKYHLGGKMLQTEWKIDHDWYAIGLSPKKDAGTAPGQGSSSTFQGYHADYVILVFDEATGVPKRIFDQGEGMMTSAKVKWVCIANPTSKNCEFAKCFTSRSWNKIKITCFDSPNLKANGIHNLDDLVEEINLIKRLNDELALERLQSYKVVRPKLLTLKWVVEKGVDWGVTHPLFVSKCLGEFPEEDENVLISLGVVERAQQRWEDYDIESVSKNCKVRSIGVDCARFGPDKTVITMLEDNVETFKKVIPKCSITEIVGEVTNLINSKQRCAREVVMVDGTGLGAGVVDGLLENQNSEVIPGIITIREVHFGAGLDDDEDKKHFANLKAKMFKALADSLKDDLAIMPEAIYQEELPTIIYRFTPKGQLAIESKEDYKKRTGMGSPDDSDSLVLANFGRVDTDNVGEFTREMAEEQAKQKPMSPGLKSGDQW